MRQDWSGTIIGVALSPVLIYFINQGKLALGFSVFVALGTSAIAVRLHWRLRKYVWFWATIAVVLALHIPLVTRIQWTSAEVHTIAFPLAVADFFIYSGAIRLAERLFLKEDPCSEEEL